MTYDEQEKNLRERYGDLLEKGKVSFDKHCDERLALRDSFNDHIRQRDEKERQKAKQDLFRLHRCRGESV